MKNLSAKASKIYNLLEVRHCEQDNKGVYCIYSRKEIAKDSGTNEKTVQRALNELEEQMYISRSKQGKMQAQRIYLLKSVPSLAESVPSLAENVPSLAENVPSLAENEHSNFDLAAEYVVDTPSDEFLDYFAAEQGLFTIDEVAEQVPEKEKREKKPPFTIEILENYLQQHGISIRENIITHEMEVQGLPEEYNFEGNSGHLGGILYSELKKAEIPSSMNAITAYLPIIAKKNGYNPVAEMLKGKIWDGKDRLTELYDIMHITDTFQQLLIHKWLSSKQSSILLSRDCCTCYLGKNACMCHWKLEF